MKKTILSLLPLLLLTAVSAAPVSAQGSLPRITTLEGDPVYTLLMPDGIASIDQPEFVSASEAKFMKNKEMVIGVVHDGVAKAYSLWHLDRHEIVNDVFGDDPVAVTW